MLIRAQAGLLAACSRGAARASVVGSSSPWVRCWSSESEGGDDTSHASRSSGKNRGSDVATSAWHSGSSVESLATVPAGQYFDVPDDEVVPEWQSRFFQDTRAGLASGSRPPRPYGCVGLEAEWAWSRSRALLSRPCTQHLASELADLAASARGQHTHLSGWTGSGKSVAMFAAVQWARRAGWVALYVPSAQALVEGGSLSPCLLPNGAEQEEESWTEAQVRDPEGIMYDAPAGARLMLRALLQVHEQQLHGVPSPSGGASLAVVAREGLAAGDDHAPVDAALDVKQGLLQQSDVPVLLALDGYNHLYHRTTFGRAVHPWHRLALPPGALRLARGMRLLEGPAPRRGATLVAQTLGSGLPAMELPNVPGSRRSVAVGGGGGGGGRAPAVVDRHVPRFDLEELRAVTRHMQARGLLRRAPGERVLQRTLAVSNGNAKEVRKAAAMLFAEGGSFAASLGNQAFKDFVKRRKRAAA